MSNEKLEEQLELACPACGGIEFDFDADESASADDEPAPDQMLECVSCKKEITYGELLLANADGIDQHVQEIGEDFAKDLTKNLKDAAKKLGFH